MWPPGKRAVERDQRRGVGAGEAVDRLGGIADDREVVRAAEPRAQEPQLQRGGVLELVDEEMAEPPALPGRELLVVRDRVGAAAEHVVEVDEVARALLGLVARVAAATPRPRRVGVRRPAASAAAS